MEPGAFCSGPGRVGQKTTERPMLARFAKAAIVPAALALLAAGCTDGSIKDFAPRASMSLPSAVLKRMAEKGMPKTSPIMARIFKEEGKLEIWKQKSNGRYDII